MSAFSEAMWIAAAGAAAGGVVTLAITKGFPLLWKAYKKRRIDPKKAEMQFFLDQAKWFYERGQKLRDVNNLLLFKPPADKFQRGTYLAKLDREDQEWTMKVSDLPTLAKAITRKAEECQENGRQSEGFAADIERKIYW